MKKINEIDQIKNLLSEGKIKDAFKKAREIFVDSSFASNNILLQGRFSRLEEEWNKGTISTTETFLEKNRISAAFLNYLEDYENEIIKEIGKEASADGTINLAQLIFTKSNIEDKFINSLKEFRTQHNKHEVEAIKRLIKYDYRISWKDSNTKISIKFEEKKLTLSNVLSYGMHTIVFEATDAKDIAYILKVLHPKLYDRESSVFKERHDKLKKLAEKSNKIAEVLDVYNYTKSEIIIARIKKYDSDLREFVIKSSLPQNEYLKKVSEIFANICEAVKFLHDNSIAHRDIIPSNILLDKNQNVYLGDFDNIQIQDSDATKIDVRHRTIDIDDIFFDVFIEPKYISQLNGEFKCTFEEAKKADIYSLSVLLLFCLIRKRFTNNIDLIDFLKTQSGDENSMKLYAIDILKFPDFLEKINNDVANFLQKGLSKNEDERYQSIDSLLKEFEKIKNNLFPPKDKVTQIESLTEKNIQLSKTLKSQESLNTRIIWVLGGFIGFFLLIATFIYLKTQSYENIKADWNRIDNTVFFGEEYEKLVKSYMDSSSYFQLLPNTDGKEINNLDIVNRIKDVEEKINGELSANSKPIRGLADYSNVLLQVDSMSSFDSDKSIFLELTSKILHSSDKLMSKESNYYSNLNDVFNLPGKLKKRIQITMVFVYYSKDLSKKKWSFLRFPRTELENNGKDYNPTARLWYLTMTKQDKKMHEGIAIDKENKTIKISPPYYSYSTVTKGPIRTIVKKIDIDENKELIYGVDIELIK